MISFSKVKLGHFLGPGQVGIEKSPMQKMAAQARLSG
jgi:hypothetical protein